MDWKKIKNLDFSDYTTNILKLFTSSALGQVINFLTIPFIARMFSQETLGLRDVYLSLITTFFISSSLKYESAIILPEKEEDTDSVIALSTLILLCFSGLLLILFLFASEFVFTLLKAESVLPYYFLAVIGVFLRGMQQILQQIATRRKLFGKFGKGTVIEVILHRSLSVGFGLFSGSVIGLFISYLTAVFGSCLYLFKCLPGIYKRGMFNFKKMKIVGVRYKKFPLINNLWMFINNFSTQVPVFIISSYFGPEIVALFSYANRLINLPVNMVSQSVSRVYYQEGAKIYNRNRAGLLSLYLNTQKKLFLLGIILIAGVFLLSPLGVSILLGKEWIETVFFMRVMVLYVFFRFLCSPVASSLTIIDKQEWNLGFGIVSLLLRAGSMILFSQSVKTMMIAYTVVMSLFYLLYNLMIFLFFEKRGKKA